MGALAGKEISQLKGYANVWGLREMRMGSEQCFLERNFIVCTVQILGFYLYRMSGNFLWNFIEKAILHCCFNNKYKCNKVKVIFATRNII